MESKFISKPCSYTLLFTISAALVNGKCTVHYIVLFVYLVSSAIYSVPVVLLFTLNGIAIVATSDKAGYGQAQD